MILAPDIGLAFVGGSHDVEDGSAMAVTAVEIETGHVAWQTTFRDPGGNGAVADLAVDPSRSAVFAVGHVLTPGQDGELTILRIDADDGTIRWAERSTTLGNRSPIGIGVASAGGPVLVALASQDGDGDGWDTILLGHGADGGQRLWRTDVETIDDQEVRPASFNMDPAGDRAFIAATTHNASLWPHGALLAFDTASGEPLWTTVTAGFERPAWFRAVETSEDGDTVYAAGAGYTRTPSTTEATREQDTDLDTVGTVGAYDAETGQPLWESFPERLTAGGGQAVDLAVGPGDTGVYMAVRTFAATVDHIPGLVQAFEPEDGTHRWAGTMQAHPYGEVQGTNIEVSDDGERVTATGLGWQMRTPVVALGGHQPLRPTDVLIQTYDAQDGVTQWSARYAGPSGSQDTPTDLQLGPDGSTFLSVTTQGPAYSVLAYPPWGG